MRNKTFNTLVIGEGRHGKDTVCDVLAKNYGFSFVSSSKCLLWEVIWPVLKGEYASSQDCFNDRINNRVRWKNILSEYNTPDKSRLASKIYEDYDIYCGLRAYDEFIVGKEKGLFDVIIGIDASERCKDLPKDDSFDIPLSVCDIIIDNNGDGRHLANEIEKAVFFLDRY